MSLLPFAMVLVDAMMGNDEDSFWVLLRETSILLASFFGRDVRGVV